MYKQMGSGTHGRVWYTNETGNIAFSCYIEANCKVEKLEGITIEIAETMIEVIQNLYQIKLEIKYPNDIVIHQKKIGGILTETKVNGNLVNSLVIGIGINTNQRRFENEIENIASSIKNEFKITVDNQRIIGEFCNRFEEKLRKRVGIE